MIDDEIEWFDDPKKFIGFMQEPNGKEDCFDIFGLYKGSNDIWVKVGYMCRRRSILRSMGFTQLFSAMYLVVCCYLALFVVIS